MSVSLLQLLKTLGIDNHPRIIPVGPQVAAGVHTVDAHCVVVTHNPATAQALAAVRLDDAPALEAGIQAAVAAFKAWREIPAPKRGLLVRDIADEFRRLKHPLATLLSLEMGKILPEALGEIQECIDIADYAVGLSRQLPGQVFPSERGRHRMFEQWLPLGPVGVITAFNFPAAVWAWNALIASICGDSILWKPSLQTPLTSLAVHHLASRVAAQHGQPDLFSLVIGADETIAERMTADRRLPLISATGSCRMGRRVAQVVAGRLGRSLLELGGNNALILNHDADLAVAVPAVVFGAVGTAGQRCTTTRRLIVHESIIDLVQSKLVAAYEQVSHRIGDPLDPGVLIGPLIDARAADAHRAAIAKAVEQGATLVFGSSRPPRSPGHFVAPAILRAPRAGVLPIALDETFAPILYVFSFRNLDDAIAMNNAVDQGLSSSLFTQSLRDAERFLSVTGSGSDCGIANVNVGTSGAEIGGAFGGEKDTGGGRESGSDAWKAYMRRQTCTINPENRVELAQGIRFE